MNERLSIGKDSRLPNLLGWVKAYVEKLDIMDRNALNGDWTSLHQPKAAKWFGRRDGAHIYPRAALSICGLACGN